MPRSARRASPALLLPAILAVSAVPIRGTGAAAQVPAAGARNSATRRSSVAHDAPRAPATEGAFRTPAIRDTGAPAVRDTGAVAVRDTGAPVRLDFQDADLRVVITAIAEAAGLNVLYGELPARRVTLHMAQPLPRSALPALLRSVAASNGLVVTEAEGFTRLVPEDRPGPATASLAPGQESTGGEARLFVYRLKHARAPRIAGTLQALFGGGRPPPAPTQRRPMSLSQGLRQDQIPAAGPAAARPEPSAPGGETPPATLSAHLLGDIQIVPDEVTNSLLVRAQEADWKVLENAIKALDLRPLQVMIEVLIVEVRRTRDRDLGISLQSTDTRGGATTVNGSLTGTSTGDFALDVMRNGPVNLHAALSALAATGDARILSRPVVVAQNNEEARILIGSERPFVQISRSLPTDAALQDQVIQYRDVGTKLTITPTINPDGYVNLQLTQEVSTATTETQFGAPVISTREAATHLFVRDGQTVVIGGLVDHERDSSRSGIPVLSEIPVLGALFGSGQSSTINSELFLFLTPTIIDGDDDADRVRRGVEDSTQLLKSRLPANPSLVPPRPAPEPPGHDPDLL